MFTFLKGWAKDKRPFFIFEVLTVVLSFYRVQTKLHHYTTADQSSISELVRARAKAVFIRSKKAGVGLRHR
jgi:hypothetical protein